MSISARAPQDDTGTRPGDDLADSIFDLQAAQLARALGAPMAFIAVRTPTSEVQTVLGAVGLGQGGHHSRLLPPGMWLGTSVQDEHVVTVPAQDGPDGQDAPEPPCPVDATIEPGLAARGVVSYAAAPLVDAEHATIGVVGVADTASRTWAPSTPDVLREVATICAASLRARDEQARARRTQSAVTAINRHNRLLLLMSEAFLEATTLEDVARTVANVASTGVGAAYTAIALWDPATREFSFQGRGRGRGGAPATEGWTREDLDDACPVSHVIANRRPLFFGDRASLLEQFPHAHPVDLGDAGDGGCAIVPLAAGRRFFGALALSWSQPREFTDQDKAVKSALAAYAAHALDRALLLEDRQHVARTLQEAMLTELPRLDGLELASLYEPAASADQVGGDWYDAVGISGGGAGVVIGDVTGHDIAAAASMGQLRSMLRAYMWNTDEPPSASLRLLDQANAGLDLGITATALVGRIDPVTDATRFCWSSAGHLPPIVRHADGTTEVLDERGDMMLGIVPSADRVDHVRTLAEGDTLLLYTDGLVERRNRPVRTGIALLRAALARFGDRSLEQVATLLMEHVAPSVLEDDVALLLVRVTPRA